MFKSWGPQATRLITSSVFAFNVIVMNINNNLESLSGLNTYINILQSSQFTLLHLCLGSL